jgi:hypothetical protein
VADAIDLCTRDDVRLALEIQAKQVSRDALIDDTITDVSQRIIDYCEREIAPESDPGVVRSFSVDWGNQGGTDGVFVDLNPYDVQTVTAAVLHPESPAALTLTAGVDYTLDPVPTLTGTYYGLRLGAYVVRTSEFALRFGSARIQITGTWGFPEVPRAIRRACIVTCASWVDRRIGTYSPQDTGSDGRTILPDTSGGLDLPNSAKRLLEPFKRGAV